MYNTAIYTHVDGDIQWDIWILKGSAWTPQITADHFLDTADDRITTDHRTLTPTLTRALTLTLTPEPEP